MPAERENFVRLLYVTLLVQFFVIAILFGALSNEYISNAYMQAWIGRNVPLLGIILSGDVDSVFIGVAVVFTIFLARRGAQVSRPESTPQPTTQSLAPVGPGLFCWFWFCFLGFPSERITHFFFHLDEKVYPAGYRCFGDISMIKALIEAQIAGESRLLTIFPQKCPDQLFKQ